MILYDELLELLQAGGFKLPFNKRKHICMDNRIFYNHYVSLQKLEARVRTM